MVEGWQRQPFHQLPVECRPQAFDFWSYFSITLKDGQLALATQLRHWLEGGTEWADVVTGFNRMMRPSESAKCKFPSDVLVLLAGEVENAAKDRRAKQEMIDRREAADKAKREALPADQVRAMLNGIGKI